MNEVDLLFQDSIVWERLAHRIVPEEAINDPCLLSETPSFKEKIRAYFFAWNPNDSSKYFFFFFLYLGLDFLFDDGEGGRRGEWKFM